MNMLMNKNEFQVASSTTVIITFLQLLISGICINDVWMGQVSLIDRSIIFFKNKKNLRTGF